MNEAEIRNDERQKVAAFVAGYGSAFLRSDNKSAYEVCAEIVAAILEWDWFDEREGPE